MNMPGGSEMAMMLVVLAITLLSIVIPLVLVILLIVWLVNKKKRDEIVLEHLVQIKEHLDSVRDRLAEQKRNR